jgi:hypothetical protein
MRDNLCALATETREFHQPILLHVKIPPALAQMVHINAKAGERPRHANPRSKLTLVADWLLEIVTPGTHARAEERPTC